MGMGGGFGQDIFHYALGEFACALVLFADDAHPQSGLDLASILAIHGVHLISRWISTSNSAKVSLK